MHASAIPPTPHPTTPNQLIVVVCESVPTTVSTCAAVEDHRSEVFQIHLMHDAGIVRRLRGIAERGLSPAQRIALAIALIFEQCIRREGAAVAELVTCRWSITRSTGISGLTFLGSAPIGEPSRIAARSTTRHSGSPAGRGRRLISIAEPQIPLGDILNV